MNAPVKWTAPRIRALKGKGKVTCLTAYDYSTARLIDEVGLHIALVGDSLGMTVLGYETTLPVTMEDMLHHTAAVARGVKQAMVVTDMPFMSYQVSIEQGLENAGRCIKAARADGVKIEGGALRVPLIKALIANGIPVMGHIGLTPQSIRAFGGYKVQGKVPEQARRLIEDAKALDAAGVFTLVIECVPADLGRRISEAVSMPTIGIGAGPGCDGQVLVLHDVLGLYGDFTPKFVKRYANLGPEVRKALEAYKREVEEGTFPGEEHCY
ncbi:MAG: 3-methyl-2-oxobutanoate hydroxymethyltransferase [Kiritimatiellae bacterium]|nr:3-methyl-2-oxobutanoate hydroxymethyltransferase [Kiritimatiellia bacterium]